jgi:hypothetical protein
MEGQRIDLQPSSLFVEETDKEQFSSETRRYNDDNSASVAGLGLGNTEQAVNHLIMT